MSALKTVTLNRESAAPEGSRLFNLMNAIAWLVLGAGVLLCLFNLSDFTDRNVSLMVGIGCMIASVQIYVIGTVIHLLQNNGKQRTPE